MWRWLAAGLLLVMTRCNEDASPQEAGPGDQAAQPETIPDATAPDAAPAGMGAPALLVSILLPLLIAAFFLLRKGGGGGGSKVVLFH